MDGINRKGIKMRTPIDSEIDEINRIARLDIGYHAFNKIAAELKANTPYTIHVSNDKYFIKLGKNAITSPVSSYIIALYNLKDVIRKGNIEEILDPTPIMELIKKSSWLHADLATWHKTPDGKRLNIFTIETRFTGFFIAPNQEIQLPECSLHMNTKKTAKCTRIYLDAPDISMFLKKYKLCSGIKAQRAILNTQIRLIDEILK